MTTVHLEGFHTINDLHRHMNRLFDDLGFSTTLHERGLAAKVPPAELEETGDALILRLELPGINPDDLTIEVMVESVSISGDRQPTSPPAEERLYQSEFRYGSIQRVISLPLRIQNTKVDAKYKDGILSLTLPKIEEEKNKVVKVAIR